MLLKDSSLKTRFMASFLLLIVLPMFLAMGVIMQRYYRVLFEAKLSESRNITIRYAEAFSEEAELLSLKVSALAYNRHLLDLVRQYRDASSRNRSLRLSREMENILDIYFDYSGEALSVLLFMENEGMYIYKNPPPSDRAELTGSGWFRQIEETPERILFLDDLTYQHISGTPPYRLAAAIRPPGDAVYGIEGILVLYRSRSLENLIRTGDERNRYAIFSGSGDVLFTEGFPEGMGKFTEPQEGFLRYSVPVRKTGWTLVNYMDIREVREPVFNGILLFLLLMSFITLLFLIYNRSLMRQIIRPIHDSIQRMSLMEKGDFSVRLPSSPIPELNRMSCSFNSMVVEIDNLTEAIRKKEREKKATEIRALQFQINPHFLSNTLNTIKIMARLIDAQSIRETTTCLMRIVSNSFREPGELNTLRQEIINIEDYIHIMKIRFGDTFRVIIRQEGNLDELRIMKMLIQPLVENAVIHGLTPEGKQGCLFIGFRRKEGKLEIRIIDNGTGIDGLPPRIEEDRRHGGLYNIGLSNVKERITMNYGREYGLRLTGRKGYFTKVTLTLPLQEETP